MPAATRRPPKRSAHRDIERQLGAPALRDVDDLDDLPPGWTSRFDEHRKAQAQESRARRSAGRPTKQELRDEGFPVDDDDGAGSRPSAPRANRQPRGGAARKRRPAGRRRPGRPTLADPTGGRLGLRFDANGIGGLFVGAVFYALALSVVQYGASGPGLWFKAKFLNEATGGATATAASSTGSTTPGARLV